MTAQVWIAILVGLAAAVDDLARRRIANWIPAAALAGGFGWQIGQNGIWTGSLHALGGAAVGFAVFLVFYLLGGMGGGDVKLMAGFGALLGLPGVLWAALWTAAFGGVIAIGAVAWQGCALKFCGGLRRSAMKSGNGRNRFPMLPRSCWEFGWRWCRKAERDWRTDYGSQISDGFGRQPGVRAGGFERVLPDDRASAAARVRNRPIRKISWSRPGRSAWASW